MADGWPDGLGDDLDDLVHYLEWDIKCSQQGQLDKAEDTQNHPDNDDENGDEGSYYNPNIQSRPSEVEDEGGNGEWWEVGGCGSLQTSRRDTMIWLRVIGELWWQVFGMRLVELLVGIFV